jgi:PAS domain S-box-containing protein
MIESEKFADKVLNTSLNGIYIHDLKLGQNVFINTRYTTLTGYSFADLRAMEKAQFFELFHPDDRQRVAAHLQRLTSNSDDMLEIEYRFKTKDGRWIWCLARDSVFARTEDGSVSQFIGTLLDITERKRTEEALREAKNELEIKIRERTAELQQINQRLKQENQQRIQTVQSLKLEEARLDALLHLSQISEASLKEISSFTLEQTIALTQSKIGFLGFLNEDESIYTLHAVSKDVVKECNVIGEPLQWHVADAGIWADAIRDRKTLFVNDYAKPHPEKKGFPAGHPYVERFMVVPILEEDKTVAVAGVGNKASAYDMSDERHVVLLLRGMWGFVQKNRSREELRQAYNELEEKVKQRTAALAASTAMLQESQKDLNRAQEVGQIGSWRLDIRRNVLTWSDENYRIFGAPKETALTYEKFLETVHPDDRRNVNARWKASLRGEPYDIEHRIVVNEQVKWVREKAYLELDDTGTLLGSFGITQDITDRKQAEQALVKAHDELEKKVKERTYELEATVRALDLEVEERKSAESRLNQLSRVFMDSSDPIVIENLSGTIIEMNREAEIAYSWKRQDLIGKSIKSIIPQERHQWAEQLRQRCLTGEEVRNWEGMRQDQFGRKFFVLVTAFPLSDESGKPVAVATIAKDITFRKQMESELEKSYQRLRDLSLKSIEALESDRRSVARELHDSIGGSLAAIKFGLEGIVEEIAKGPDQAAASLEKSISYLTETIKETKRIAANLRPLTLDDLGLLATIDWHTRQFSQQFSNIQFIKQIDICEEDIPDSSKIVVYRVLQEALNNCAKHSKADEVHICLKKNGNEIEFELKDNGCGFNVEEILNRNDPLVGNGLKNMRERAEICGALFFLNTQPGAGTTIRLLFPRA